MWNAIGLVTGAFSLVAFIAAVAYLTRRRHLIATEKMVSSASEASRSRVIEAFLSTVHVDTAGLTRDQRYTLALRILTQRERESRQKALLIGLVALVSGSVAAIAFFKPSEIGNLGNDHPRPTPTGVRTIPTPSPIPAAQLMTTSPTPTPRQATQPSAPPQASPAQPPAPIAQAILIRARDFVDGEGVAVDECTEKRGFLANKSPCVSRPNSAEFEFEVVAERLYRLDVLYASDEHRPVRVSLDGKVVRQSALSDQTGGWHFADTEWNEVGTWRLGVGTHRLRLDRNDYFPHIHTLRWTPE